MGPAVVLGQDLAEVPRPAGHHLGECGDGAGGGAELRAAVLDPAELVLIPWLTIAPITPLLSCASLLALVKVLAAFA